MIDLSMDALAMKALELYGLHGLFGFIVIKAIVSEVSRRLINGKGDSNEEDLRKMW